MADTTETILIRWLVDAKQITDEYAQLQEATAKIKQQMKELAATTGATYKELSKKMVQAFSSAEIKRVMENPANALLSMTQVMEKAKPAIDNYKLAMASAMSEIKTEVQASSDIQTTASRNLQAEQKREAEIVKQAQLQERDARRQTAKSTQADVEQQVIAMKYLESEAKKGAGVGGGGGAGGLLGGLFGEGMSGILPQLLGIAGGIGLITSQVRKFSQAIQEATQSGLEFVRGMYQMEVGIRALQRAGVQMTMKDAYTQIENLRRSFGIFTTKELVVGSAAFYNLNRDMGFTKEQLFSLQNAIATLAVVNGRAMDEVQKTVALALSSGYTEGLQRLGVSINRVTIAAEAARLGWEGGYTSLTEQQRALATYNLVISKTNIYQQDLMGYQKSLPGMIDSATKSIEEQKNILGEYLQGLNLVITKSKQWFFDIFIFRGALGGFARTLATITYLIKNFGQIASHAFERVKDFLPPSTVDNIKFVVDILNKGVFEIRQAISSLVTEILNLNDALGILIFGDQWDYFKGVFEDLRTIAQGKPLVEEMAGGNVPEGKMAYKIDEETLAAAQEAVENSMDELEDIEKDAAEQREENLRDHQRDVEEAWIDHQRKLEELKLEHERRLEQMEVEHQRRLADIATDYQRRMRDIQNSVLRDMADARRKYDQDVKDAWADYYAKLAGAAEKHRNQEIDAEIKYQEKLRKLREGFLLDMEDAIRERDAKQALQLIRRYNLEKTQAGREYSQERERLDREYQLQLSEMARQRDERLRQLAEELAIRYAEIQREAERERAQAALDAKRKQEDEKTRYDQDKIDEKTRYDQDKIDEKNRYILERRDQEERYRQEQEDLEKSIQDRLQAIAQGYVDQVGYTNQAMAAIRQSITQTLGPGGYVPAMYDYVVAYAATRMAQLAGLNFYQGPKPEKDRAKGGIDVANTPTNVTFGEAGPEMHMFIPLSQNISKMGNELVSTTRGKNGNGKVLVEVLLDKYLEGKIIDTTIDNVADVIIRRLR